MQEVTNKNMESVSAMNYMHQLSWKYSILGVY